MIRMVKGKKDNDLEDKTKAEVIICRCEEVTEDEVQKAIDDGARSLKGIKRRTFAGMGLCQGRTCGRLIAQKLAKKLNQEEILPDTQRPPVRTVKIGAFVEEEEGEEEQC